MARENLKTPEANTYLLALVCRAQAEDALLKGSSLLATARIGTSSQPEAPPGELERPAVTDRVLRVRGWKLNRD